MHSDKFNSKSTSQAIWEDYLDFKIVLVDNGDDKVSLRTYLGDKKELEISCSMFLPSFHPCKVMLGGHGQAAYIKSIQIKQSPRNDNPGNA